MTPKTISRIRSGVNRLFRWKGTATSNNVVSDPIHLSSCLIDLWYTTGVGVSGGAVVNWLNIAPGAPKLFLADGDEVITLGGQGVTTDGKSFLSQSTDYAVTGVFTCYWLAEYAGVEGIVLGHSSTNQSSIAIAGTTAEVTNSGGTAITKDGTLDGNRLYRWRRASDNKVYFKPGAGTEVEVGSLTGTLTFNQAFKRHDGASGDLDDAGNYTRRILLYNADLVTDGTSGGVEAAISDTLTNQVTLTFPISGTWVPGNNWDSAKRTTFTAIGKGGAGENAKAGGGNGGGGGGYGSIVLPANNSLGFTKASTFTVDITGGTVSIIDPNAATICSGAVGSAGGVLDNAGGAGFATSAAGYSAARSGNGGRGGDQGFGGGGGGGGSGGATNGVSGGNATSTTGGAGGTVHFAGGNGGTVGGADSTAGTTPGGGGGGDASDGTTGAAGGEARGYITYYMTTTAMKAPNGHNITSITNDGSGAALVLCAAPHGLTTGASVTISGNSNNDYNDTDTITVIDADEFILDTIAYTSDGTGGRWD